MKNIILALFIGTLGACSFDNKVVHIVDIVDVFDSPEENLKVSQDLLAYDFRNEMAEELSLGFESKIAGKVFVEYFVQESNSETSIRVITNNLDKGLSDQFMTFYTDFIKRKKEQHFSKRAIIKKVEKFSEDLLLLMDQGALDSIWSYVSPSLMKLTSKEDFLQMLRNRDIRLTESEQRKLYCTRVVSEIGELAGDFYSISHIYRDNLLDEIVLEEADGKMSLLGYTTHMPN